MTAPSPPTGQADLVDRRDLHTGLRITWLFMRIWTPTLVRRWPLPVMAAVVTATMLSLLAVPGGPVGALATASAIIVLTPPLVSLLVCLLFRRWVYAHDSHGTTFVCLHKPWPWQDQSCWKASALTSTGSPSTALAVLRYVLDFSTQRKIRLQVAATGRLVSTYIRFGFTPLPQSRVERLLGITMLRREP